MRSDARKNLSESDYRITLAILDLSDMSACLISSFRVYAYTTKVCYGGRRKCRGCQFLKAMSGALPCQLRQGPPKSPNCSENAEATGQSDAQARGSRNHSANLYAEMTYGWSERGSTMSSFPQSPLDLRPNAVTSPPIMVVPHRGSIGIGRWQLPPPAVGAEKMKDRIHNLPHVQRTVSAAALRWREMRSRICAHCASVKSYECGCFPMSSERFDPSLTGDRRYHDVPGLSWPLVCCYTRPIYYFD